MKPLNLSTLFLLPPLLLPLIVFISFPNVCVSNQIQEISLTLEDSTQLALQYNRGLLNSASSIESLELALNSTESEFNLKFIPSSSVGITNDGEDLGASLSLKKKFLTGPSATISPGITKSYDNYSGSLAASLSIPLLRGLGKKINEDAIRRSNYSLRASKRNFYIQQVNVVLETVSAFYNILQQDELVKFFYSQVGTLKHHSQLAKIKEKVGLATPIDIYRAEIRIKDVEDQRAIALEGLRDAKDRLKLILSIPLDTPIKISAQVEPKRVNIGSEEAIKIAMKNRVELKQSEDEVNEIKEQSEIAKHNTLPQFDLVLDYDKYNPLDDFERSIDSDDNEFLSLRIVSSTDWKRTTEKTNYQQSLLNVKTTRLNFESKQEEIKIEVRRQLEALQKAEERIKIRKDQIKQAEGKLELSKIKFNHNMADNFDVIEAETEFRQARVYLLSVETEYIIGTYKMRAVLGTLIEH